MKSPGITQAEAEEQLRSLGPNRLPGEERRGLLKQILAVLSEPMLLLLIAAAAISFLLGEPLEAALLGFGVLGIIGISLFQVRRTDAALAELKRLTAPLATVVRDGLERRVPSEEVVVGDLLVLRQGDRVSADAELFEVANLEVDESTLTGESIAVGKQEQDSVFAGSLVVSGHALGIVRAIASSTQMGQIGTLLGEQRDQRTPLQLQIDTIVRWVAGAALLVAGAVTLSYWLTRDDFLNGALAGIAAAMALLPEELPIVFTVFMGLGALRLSRKKVIVASSPAIETLGSLTVLCVDKTGTLTENQMSLIDPDAQVQQYGMLAASRNSADPMDKAFLRNQAIPEGWSLLGEYPLTDAILAVGQVWNCGDENLKVAVKGAPEAVLSLLNLDEERERRILESVSSEADLGHRILLVASGLWDARKQLPPDLSGFALEYVGLAILSDPIRPGVPEAVAQLSRAGIRTIMITGDFPGTALSIAKEIGLQNGVDYLTGSDLEQLSDEELIERLESVQVFSRMLPVQKLRLVELLQGQGEVVGMTGDGVNDAPALKRAHVGIAMGVRGSAVAREASDLIIADDSFVSIATGIAEGRRIYANLRKAAAYIIAIHIPLFGLALLPLANPLWPLILLPAQIALLEILIDPAASVAYQAEAASSKQMASPPRPGSERLISRSILTTSVAQGLVLLLTTAAVFLVTLQLGLSDGQVRLVSFTILVSGNLMLMMTNRSGSESLWRIIRHRSNRVATGLFFVGYSAVALIHALPALQAPFRFEEVPAQFGLLAALAGLAPLVFHELLKVAQRRRS